MKLFVVVEPQNNNCVILFVLAERCPQR